MSVPDAPVDSFQALQGALVHLRHQWRGGGAHQAALRQMEALQESYPLSGLLWQERGLCLYARGEREAAEAALRRAVELNDALPEGWRALLAIAQAAGRSQEVTRAAAALAKLESLPAELLQGSSCLSEGDLDRAEALIRGFLVKHGPHLDGMRLLAQLSVDRKSYDDAELLLEAVLDRKPDYHDARYELGMVFILRRRFYPALLQAQRLLALNPGDRKTRLLYANACEGLGKFEESLRVFRELLAEHPDDSELEFKIAFALRNSGRAQDAVEAIRHVMRLEGSLGAAYAALADMKTYRFSDAEIDDMRRIAADPQLASQHLPVSFALGKALEDRKEYDESFRSYAQGNSLRRGEGRYKRLATERMVEMREALFTAEFFAARRGAGYPSPDPIFIVGMPRAGSTLLEQILASHSQVDGTLELPEIPRLVKQFRARRSEEPDHFARVVSDLSAAELRRLGEIYIEETRVYREQAPFFIDKMPSNFQDIGFIHLILPNAKIVDARRDAMACCFSNFQQLFGNGQDFSYDLGDVGHYYRNYVRLMDHWDRALPGKVLRIWHSDTVNDFDGTVRRVLEYCGLPFEQACLQFYKTERSVRTVSSEQVRQPINRAGIDRWRHYERWLGELKEALGPLADSTFEATHGLARVGVIDGAPAATPLGSVHPR